jgi:hypothetical protein
LAGSFSAAINVIVAGTKTPTTTATATTADAICVLVRSMVFIAPFKTW